ncbi:MAG: hypothetical protein AAGJ18_21665 [Bacteroidota bacterium]
MLNILGKFLPAGFVEVHKVATGIFLKLDVGIIIFLPKSAFGSEEKMNSVYEKLKNA